ncbi:MAG: carboxylating nicotinate-nucleotide diphosphorylase [Betaproteobacteria bacterium]|jgi:nicotinate-nucleotide pyrophosphorylase (carboxylating)|nr:MAG: carboxylating nicotinate-nucleotide diphosphorylase [Betaproteobacteria bacterium]
MTDQHLPNEKLRDDIERAVAQAISEDVGSGDVTAALVGEEVLAHAHIVTREDCTVCGGAWLDEVFRQLDPRISVQWHVGDGDHVAAKTTICDLRGPARPLLTGERTALNFLQTLSAVATKTGSYVKAVSGTRAAILDTRKTIPGLRLALKYAVKTGGGVNHRIGLYDGILIKENHIAAAGGVGNVLTKAREIDSQIPIQIEVETIEQLEQAIASDAKLILLDNFTTEEMAEAVKVTAGRAELEASGGITLTNVRAIAKTGVDRISIGDLTKDIQAIDLSMRFMSMS